MQLNVKALIQSIFIVACIIFTLVLIQVFKTVAAIIFLITIIVGCVWMIYSFITHGPDDCEY